MIADSTIDEERRKWGFFPSRGGAEDGDPRLPAATRFGVEDWGSFDHGLFFPDRL